MQQYTCGSCQPGGDVCRECLMGMLTQDNRPSLIMRPTSMIRNLGPQGEVQKHLIVTDTLFENGAFEMLTRKQSTVWTGGVMDSGLDAECPAGVVVAGSGIRSRVLKSEELTAVTALNYMGADTAPTGHKSGCIQTSEVSKSLDTRTKALRDVELLFTRAVESMAVGLAFVDINGDLTFTNSSFQELATLQTEGDNKDYLTCVCEEDRERVHEIFHQAIARGRPAQWEARMGHDYPERGWKYWVSCNMVMQSRAPRGYMLTLADITQVKLAEGHQRQLTEEAVTRRCQQQRFMDIFSHELRNPFSAAMQSAVSILIGIKEYKHQGGYLNIDDIAEAANTIVMCVQTQLRIIDDVLTVSKLDSNSMILSVVPMDVQIHRSIFLTLKIFQFELQVKGITAVLIIEDSYQKLALNWVKCDPSRFSQIVVNLITNAIKFTALRAGRREIRVTLGACTERPLHSGAVTYPSAELSVDDSTDPGDDTDSMNADDSSGDDGKIEGEGWGNGEPVYLHVNVRDTGIGISTDWQKLKKLFNRFAQAPKTNVTYGGSGLGLFICRKLCGLQGGRIGVWSEEGKGSEFAFYIRARRTVPPLDAQESDPITRLHIINDATHPRGSSTDGGPLGRILAREENRPLASFIPEHITAQPRMTVRRAQSSPTLGQLIAAGSDILEECKGRKSPSREIQPYRVLIVDDNFINQRILCRQLCKRGCITHLANNGQEGLEFVEASEFGQEGGEKVDVVLMDMEMPVMDGNTATRKIRQEEAEGRLRRHIPILGTSGHARHEQVAEMIQAGMDDIITKPFTTADIVIKVGQLVERFGTAGGQRQLGKKSMQNPHPYQPV
ncbi:hypothetical protein BGX38DRAFT_260509 [Terfezia claveryi]|nr:hypothetical protein BGX38DRAFT_260509 [Terfezia claveryi]